MELENSSLSHSLGMTHLTENYYGLYPVYFPGGLDGKASAYNVGDPGSIPGSGRSGEGNGNPLQCSCLENPRDRGAWQGTVCRVARVRHD